MPEQTENQPKDKRSYLRGILEQAVEHANQMEIDEPLLVVPKELYGEEG
jgi:hypothetical protein